MSTTLLKPNADFDIGMDIVHEFGLILSILCEYYFSTNI